MKDAGPREPSLISVGKIVKTRGTKGEVAVEPLTDFPERFSLIDRFYLRLPDGSLRTEHLTSFWSHRDRIIAKIEGVDSIDAAKALVGSEIQLPAEQLLPLPRDSYYDFQLIGCRVMVPSGDTIGVVEEVLKAGENSLLVVRGREREYLIPAAREILLSVDVDSKKIIADPPEGLLELNR